MAEISHLHGDISGESLVHVDESPTADELSGDGIGYYEAQQRLACPPVNLLMVCHVRRLEWVK